MEELHVFRHAQSRTNAPGGFWPDGPKTIPLTLLGERQAEQFANDWQIEPDILVSSSYTRSIQTLEPLARKFETPVITLPVQEFTYWNLRMSPAEYASRQRAVKLYWDRLDTQEKLGEGSETFEEFVLRVLAFKKWATESSYRVGVVCTHGFFLHAFRAVMRTDYAADEIADPNVASKDFMKLLRDTLHEAPYANLSVEKYTFES